MKNLIKIISISVLMLVLFGCPLPIQDTETPGTLTLNFSMNGGARTLLPEIDMDVADYDITGTGPDGASFEISTSNDSVEIPGLAFGEWTVIVQANNADSTVIGTGDGTTTVHTGENSYLNITVTPLDGYGTLDLTLLWNAEDTEIPSIEAQLIPSSGPAVDLDFTITGGNTGTFTLGTIPTGYHTLSLKLLDNGLLTMGAVEVVRIVKDETTSGIFEFYDINEPGGNIQINITPEMGDPLLVLLSGAAATKPENQSLALGASVSDYTGNVTYVWFVNGDSVSTGETFSFDDSWAQGYYRVDVTAYSVDGSRAGSDSVFVEVTEPEGVTGFQTVWKTDNSGVSGDNQITLPLVSNGTYDFTVNWGDGNSDIITAYNQAGITHTYAASGTYDVSISGEIVGWSFNNIGDPQKFLEVANWGSLGFGATSGQFRGCVNMTISADDKPDLTGTTSLSFAFQSCSSLVSIPLLNDWDTSSVTNMSNMIASAKAFNGDLSGLDTSAVTNMNGMFSYATAFNGDISGWDTSAVTVMIVMFSSATVFNGDISDWDVSNVTDMSYMFYEAIAFNDDISGWDTSSVTIMYAMFNRATAFNGDISGWDTSGVTNMSQMFYQAKAFNGDISGWDTSSVTIMSAMFGQATAFNTDISRWDTSGVTNMSKMFNRATAFNGDISDWDVSNVTDMSYMFYDVTLSTPNYDSLLTGWEGQSVQDNISFHGGNSQHSSGVAAEARQRLIDDHSWIITDGGQE